MDLAGEVDARGTIGPLSPAQVLQLQRAAGNQATVRALARRRSPLAGRDGRLLQREVFGTDPLEDLARPEARGLIYGMSPARAPTSQRLTFQDARFGYDVYRTVDEYNLNAGINDAFGAGGKNSATAIFKVREALEETDPITKWKTHFPTAKDPNSHADLKAWILFLAKRRGYVGLYDLAGAGKGVARVDAKHRLTKNLKSAEQASQTTLTAEKISDWLAADRTFDGAEAGFDTKFTAQEQQDIGKWMYSTFFRRTSKLGIDFTVGRGETLHMNIAADPTYDPSKAKIPNMRQEGLKEIQDIDPVQQYGRSITSSEYRHAKKLVEKDRLGTGHINFYSELKDQPAAITMPLVAVPAPKKKKKKKWYKPWTWFK